MLALGLLLIILALLIGAGIIYEGGEPATIELFGMTLTTKISGVFVAGAITMLLLLLGVWLLMASMGRARRKRADRKQAKKSQKQSVHELEEDRAALKAENERLAGKLAETGAPASASAATSGTAGATGGTDGRQNDRVIDDTTDASHEQSSASGRHRDMI